MISVPWLGSRAALATLRSRLSGKLVENQNKLSRSSCAVFLPLCHKDNKLSLLYTKRADTLNSHTGQVRYYTFTFCTFELDGSHFIHKKFSRSTIEYCKNKCLFHFVFLSFPGGRCDDGEKAADTSVREMEEEIGLSPLEVWGSLKRPVISLKMENVYGCVGYMGSIDNSEFRLSEDEVLDDTAISPISLLIALMEV